MDIKKRGRKYAITYRDGNGRVVQESFKTHDQAMIRRAEILYLKALGKPVFPPSRGGGDLPLNITVTDLLARYSAQADWGANAAGNNAGIVANYIAPNIGSLEVRRLTPDILAKYLDDLKSQPAVIRPGHSDTGATVGDSTIEKIRTILSGALEYARRQKVVASNPIHDLQIPRKKAKRKKDFSDEDGVWSIDQINTALDFCSDLCIRALLILGSVLAMRIGEICGLTWPNVMIYDAPIVRAGGLVYGDINIGQQLQRVRVADLERNKAKQGTIFVFPGESTDQMTVLALVTPKDDSIRRVYYSGAVRSLLLDLLVRQEGREKLGLGDYCGHKFVLAQDTGHPYERRLLERRFKAFIDTANEKGANLPPVVPHSLRHTGASVILRASSGNVKATQAITGHASAEVLLDTYATSFAEDRMDAAIAADAALSGSQPQNNTN